MYNPNLFLNRYLRWALWPQQGQKLAAMQAGSDSEIFKGASECTINRSPLKAFFFVYPSPSVKVLLSSQPRMDLR